MRAALHALLSILLCAAAAAHAQVGDSVVAEPPKPGADLQGEEVADIGLEHALRVALQKHPTVMARASDLEALEYRVDEARAGRLPSVTVQAQALDNTDNRGVARLSQPLWAFGRIDGAIALAKRRRDTGRLQWLESQREVMRDVAVGYAELNGLWQRLAEAVRNLQEHQTLQDLIKRRALGGLAADADVRLASARTAQARIQRDRLRADISRQMQVLESLVQMPISALSPVPDSLMIIPASEVLERQVDESAIGVQLRIAELETVKAEADQRQSELYPTLSARVERDIGSRRTNAVDAEQTRAGVVLEAALEGTGLAGFRRVRAETSRIEAAEEDLRAARIEARREVRGLSTDLELSARLLQSQEEAIAATAENVQSYLRLFDAGKKSWLDVLNTQRELSENRQAAEQTRVERVQTALRLAVLSGQLDRLVASSTVTETP